MTLNFAKPASQKTRPVEVANDRSDAAPAAEETTPATGQVLAVAPSPSKNPAPEPEYAEADNITCTNSTTAAAAFASVTGSNDESDTDLDTDHQPHVPVPADPTADTANSLSAPDSSSARGREDVQGKGRRGRTYQPSWKEKFPWITYDLTKNKIFCSICTQAVKKEAPLPNLARDQESIKAFVHDGFYSWNKALERFRTHEKSDVHRAASHFIINVSAGVNVVASMSEGKQKQMATASQALRGILSSLRYLATQGLAIRGKTDEESNLIRLLHMRGEEAEPELQAWLGRKEYKWLSHDVLNEMAEIMAHDVLRTLTKEIQSAECFSVMADETADITVKEQVSICIRFVNDNLETEEYFLGFYETSKTSAETLFRLLKDVLTRLALPVSKCRGQCYDGAANMAGVRTGLQARMLELEPRALYVHCTAHVLNLVVQDVAQNIPTCVLFLGIVRELITLIRDSPKRLAWFKEFQDKESPSLRPLCPTRWTVRTASLKSIESNYSALMDFLEDMYITGGASASKANGLLLQLQKFSTFFSLQLMLTFFSRVEQVNTSLQNHQLHLQKAKEMVDKLRGTITSLKEGFQTFWESTTAAALKLELDSPEVPRLRRVPRRYVDDDDGGAPPPAPRIQTPEEMHRQQYKDVMEAASKSLDSRFSDSVFTHMQHVEDFVVGKSDCQSLVHFYGNDFDETRLTLHRDMCIDMANREGICLSTFNDVVNYLKGEKGASNRAICTELTRLVKQALTIPVTSCSSERSFSSLRRLKTYLRSTMGQARLNHLVLLNTHKHVARKMDLDIIANTFITRSSVRSNTFLLRKWYVLKSFVFSLFTVSNNRLIVIYCSNSVVIIIMVIVVFFLFSFPICYLDP